MRDGALALRFEWLMIAVYDIHILKRPRAERDYTADIVAAAAERFRSMDGDARLALERTIIAGLPGSEESFTSAEFLDAIGTYTGIDSDRLRENHIAFLEAICPVAEDVGIRMVVHPDDPPFPIFGIARVVSTADDLQILFDRVPSPANGVCFCCGSFGARLDNDLPAMIERFAPRIGFLHLRSVEHTGYRTFHEAAHLEGDAPMAEIVTQVHAICTSEKRSVPIRPDHGHQMLDDLTKTVNPGYSLLGRMRGLAELRGLELGIAHSRASRTSDTSL
jgi:mannonate dehydratase